MTGLGRVHLRLAASSTPLPEADLTEGEAAQAAALPSAARRRSWLTARRALRRALAEAGLPADTSGYVFPHRCASISYACDYAVATVVGGDTTSVLGVGVDVETGLPPAPETARLFLTEHERSALGALPAPRRRTELLRMWTVKEALFKADPDNTGIDLCRYTLNEPLARRGTARLAGTAVAAFRYLSLDLPRGALSVALRLSR